MSIPMLNLEPIRAMVEIETTWDQFQNEPNWLESVPTKVNCLKLFVLKSSNLIKISLQLTQNILRQNLIG